jgi:hypothetical protein
MAPREPNPWQRARLEPLFDLHPRTGVSIEFFFANRTMETFGRLGSGWFWWSRRRGYPPVGPAAGPFPTSYAAYRHAMTRAAAAPNTDDCGARRQSNGSHVELLEP